jgi:hypothetical protein
MDQRDAGRLLAKATGLFVVAYTLIWFPENIILTVGILGFRTASPVPSIMEAFATPQFWGMCFAPFLIDLAIGLGLIGWGSRAAHPVAPQENSATTPAPWRAIEAIGLTILGLYFLGEGLADAAHWTAAELADAAANHGRFGASIWSAQFGIVGGAVMRIGIGTALLLRRSGFVALRWWTDTPRNL